MAAGFNYSVTSILLAATAEAFYAQLVSLLIYTVIVINTGKILTFHMLRDECLPSRNPLFTLVRKHRLSPFFRHVISESAGFAWKELFLYYIFRYALERDGGVEQAIYGWLTMVVFIASWIIISSHVQKRFFNFDENLHVNLLHYDTEMFALPIAFNLTVLIAVLSEYWGFGFVSPNSYLFTWKRNYGEKSTSQTLYLPFYIAYATAVTFIVAGLQYTEVRLRDRPMKLDRASGAIQDNEGIQPDGRSDDGNTRRDAVNPSSLSPHVGAQGEHCGLGSDRNRSHNHAGINQEGTTLGSCDESSAIEDGGCQAYRDVQQQRHQHQHQKEHCWQQHQHHHQPQQHQSEGVNVPLPGLIHGKTKSGQAGPRKEEEVSLGQPLLTATPSTFFKTRVVEAFSRCYCCFLCTFCVLFHDGALRSVFLLLWNQSLG